MLPWHKAITGDVCGLLNPLHLSLYSMSLSSVSVPLFRFLGL